MFFEELACLPRRGSKRALRLFACDEHQIVFAFDEHFKYRPYKKPVKFLG
jgi:hypothetical protein